MTLLVATTNPNKLREIRPLLAGMPIDLLTLGDFPPMPEPDESGATFWENARLKALAYAAATGALTVAEDSGLEIEALGGEPGVRSARFLGADTPYPVRFAEIDRRLQAHPGRGRRARFVTALALADGGARLQPDATTPDARREPAVLFETEAAVEGMIAPAPSGIHGFGYDPIFFYPPFGCTTADMTSDQKAAVSHRARAFRDLARHLHARVR